MLLILYVCDTGVPEPVVQPAKTHRMMKRILIPLLALIAAGMTCAQQPRLLPPGYPDRSQSVELEKGFRTPPAGYGEVPFYWWIGDTLTREHIKWQLDMLAEKRISSLQVNYCHTDTGGITYGRTFRSQPELFTPAWWELFGWFMEEAGKHGMTVSLSDYTLGAGQGSYVDEMLAEDPGLNGSELHFDRTELGHGERFARSGMQKPLSLKAYRLDDGGRIAGESVDLLPEVGPDGVEWQNPWPRALVTEVKAERRLPSLDPMHPQAGRSYVRHFFQRFEDRLPGKAETGLNFFFSDELSFNLQGHIWNGIFRDEFMRRKGYDILPQIDALFIDLGDISAKIRLDYNDVRVALSEEHFFIPIYEWHQQRGLLFGCDHGGRGRDVSEFGDYFRTQRWNQAPGCDQPMLQKDIIKNKVASSISHLYERQRVWLEGFHSSGWSTNSAQLTDAIFANYAMGQNLLSLHGLYYTTMGGWWEWAAPCNHFHEPYWDEMDELLACTERLSYVLSQGHHVADVAVLYPVEPVVAGYGNEAVEAAFAAGEAIYRDGIDFDFMDYESLARAEVHGGRLHVAGESFGVVVVPAMRAIRHASLVKLRDFVRDGGMVVNIGPLPEASEQEGRNGRELTQLVADIFGGGYVRVFRVDGPAQVVSLIDRNTQRDFTVLGPRPEGQTPFVMHRRIAGRDLYAVYNVDRGVTCRFRARGAAELWNPWTGEKRPLRVVSQDEGGTQVAMPLESTDMQLIVFDPAAEPEFGAEPAAKPAAVQIALDGEWKFRLEPLLDNRFGDYHWPATDEKLGAYIYDAEYERLGDGGRKGRQRFAFGEKFLLLGAVPASVGEETVLANLPSAASGIEAGGVRYEWQPYEFSWRWGVEGDYGHQGWHGLKAEMYDDFIRLGDTERAFNGMVRRAEASGMKDYYLYTCVEAPCDGAYAAEWGEMLPAGFFVNGQRAEPAPQVVLKKGVNEILLHYDSFGTTRFALRDGGADVAPETLAEAPLRMKFRGDRALLAFDTRKKAATRARFVFTAAPGLEALEFTAFGRKPEVRADGRKCRVGEVARRSDGAVTYRAALPAPAAAPARVTVTLTEERGYAGGAAIDGPLKLVCGEGLYTVGDWCRNDALRTYSGAAWYTADVDLEVAPAGCATLDLGEVVSTAKVLVNGREAGLRFTPPWRFDVTGLLHAGNNRIEIRVCNTTANIFLASPTVYRGDTKAGILGPVRLEIGE